MEKKWCPPPQGKWLLRSFQWMFQAVLSPSCRGKTMTSYCWFLARRLSAVLTWALGWDNQLLGAWGAGGTAVWCWGPSFPQAPAAPNEAPSSSLQVLVSSVVAWAGTWIILGGTAGQAGGRGRGWGCSWRLGRQKEGAMWSSSPQSAEAPGALWHRSCCLSAQTKLKKCWNCAIKYQDAAKRN